MNLVHGVSLTAVRTASQTESQDLVVAEQQRELLRQKYTRANALIASILNKYYNGSSRAVDPFVIRYLQEEETRFFSIQCFIEEGPAEQSRERKESIAMRNAARTQSQATLFTRFIGVCGGYMGGPGSIMRQWDVLSETTPGYEEAMFDYIAIVDKMLPGWDHVSEYPVAKQDRFWKDDASVEQCQYCALPFTLQNRRHHCRMCLDIFCATCCAETLEMAQCPGAPLRLQRVCASCFEEAEKDKSLLEVRRMIRANHEIEQHIRDIQTATDAVLATKHKEEVKFRTEAILCGCDMELLDTQIQKKIGTSPVSVAQSSIKTPAAHKFKAGETVEANTQLALANRQLLMGLKVAQCRSKKAIEKMDLILAILREAICFGSSSWNVVLRRMHPYLTLKDVKSLLQVNQTLRSGVERYQCEKYCMLHQSVSPTLRPLIWQAESLKNVETRVYLSDLAEAIRTRSGDSDSDSETEVNSDGSILPRIQSPPLALPVDLMTFNDEGGRSSPVVHAPPRLSSSMPWRSLLSTYNTTTDLRNKKASAWHKVYEFILVRCAAASTALEHDAQIVGDVNRTFGVSSLRKNKKKTYQRTFANPSTAIPVEKPVEPMDNVPLETKKQALTNVLRAFSSVNTGIGYCQGMDHVAALILSVVRWNESQAFWLFTSIIVSPRYQLDLLYCPGIPHLNLRFFQLEKVMAIHLPELYQYLQEMEYPVSMFSTGWFMTLFTNMDALSYDLVLRVFDGFLVSGWKMIFRLALVILEALQHHILASSFEEIPQLFYDIQTNAPILSSVDRVLLNAAEFKITNTQLKQLEEEYDRSIAAPSIPSRSALPSKQQSTSPPQSPPKTVMALHSQLTTISSGRMSFTSPLLSTGSSGTNTPRRLSGTATIPAATMAIKTPLPLLSPCLSNPPSPEKQDDVQRSASGKIAHQKRHSLTRRLSRSTDIDEGQKSPDTTRQATTTVPLHYTPPIVDHTVPTYIRRSITASQNYF